MKTKQRTSLKYTRPSKIHLMEWMLEKKTFKMVELTQYMNQSNHQGYNQWVNPQTRCHIGGFIGERIIGRIDTFPISSSSHKHIYRVFSEGRLKQLKQDTIERALRGKKK